LTQHEHTTLLSTSLYHTTRARKTAAAAVAAAAAAAHIRRVYSLSAASLIGRTDGWTLAHRDRDHNPARCKSKTGATIKTGRVAQPITDAF